jgi:hypothetical protein
MPTARFAETRANALTALRRHFKRFGQGYALRYADLPAEQQALFARVQRTARQAARVATLGDAIGYVVRANVPGDLVECGVWQGGRSMAAALTFGRLGADDRRLWLYDTFGEMPAPGERDRDDLGRDVKGQGLSMLGDSALSPAEVQAAMRSTGYPEHRVTYVARRVEDTIPAPCPEQIARLRLDTDWYASTRDAGASLPAGCGWRRPNYRRLRPPCRGVGCGRRVLVASPVLLVRELAPPSGPRCPTLCTQS